MIHEEWAVRNDSINSSQTHIEMPRLAAGRVADLCRISSALRVARGEEDEDDGEEGGDGDIYYRPLDPFELPEDAKPPHIEPGRISIRLEQLDAELRRDFGGLDGRTIVGE